MPTRPRSSTLRRSFERGGPLAVALALGVVLVGTSALSFRDAKRTAGIVAERQGVGFIRRIEGMLARAQHPDATPRVPGLALESNRALGLTYVGVFERQPDGGVGRVVAEAGSPVLADQAAGVGAPVFGRGHVRMVSGGPPGQPPFGLPPGPPPEFPHPPGAPDVPPPPPQPRHRPAVVVEFEPIGSTEAVQRALRVLWLASGAALLLTAAAAGLALRAARAERAEAEHSARRHLAQLGEMSAVLAHELRNPLAALKGHAQLLAERAPADLAPRVARVVDEAVRLEQLTNDLLEFARSGAIDVAPAAPRALVDDAARATDAARISVVEVDAPATHALDAARMRQVLVNLLENALAVTPTDEKVTVTIGREGAALTLTVRDHGPGIAAADRARVFEPFFTTKTSGTGLGLAVARRIVALHGGRLDVADALGGGAVFRVYLPRQR